MHDIVCTAARKWSAQEDRSNPDQLKEAGWVQASEALACSTVAVWREGRKGLAQDSAQGEGAPQVHVNLIHMACKQPEGQGAPQVHVTVIHMACKQPEGQGAPQVHVTLIHMACKQPEGQGAPQVHVTLVHMACKQHSQDSEPAQLLFSLCTPFPGQHKHRCWPQQDAAVCPDRVEPALHQMPWTTMDNSISPALPSSL